MIKSLNLILTTFFLLFFTHGVFSQEDCILGVGITKDSVLVDVFQLNAIQTEKLTGYSEEVKYTQDILNKTLQEIRERHPQSTVAELSKLASEYTFIMDSMFSVQTTIDKKLLVLFNEKQYTLYHTLCAEAFKSPIVVVPAVYRDSL